MSNSIAFTATALTEQQITSELKFQGNFLRVLRDTVSLPNGNTSTREYVVHPGAVVIVPLLDDGRVVLERQYRYPIGKVMIELPAGKLEQGEDPLLCGLRELQEETGYTCSEWACAGHMHLAIAYSTEVIHIFFARGLHLGERQLDEGEFLDVFTAPAQQLIDWCLDGTVTDAKTLSCVVHLQNFLLGHRELAWQSVPRMAEKPPARPSRS